MKYETIAAKKISKSIYLQSHTKLEIIKISELQAWKMIKDFFSYFGRFDHEILDIIQAWKKKGYIQK